jgi:hypothetical protein
MLTNLNEFFKIQSQEQTLVTIVGVEHWLMASIPLFTVWLSIPYCLK